MILFFLYESGGPAETAAKAYAAIARADGHETHDLSSPDFEAKLLSAARLFVFYDKPDDYYSRKLDENWRIYHDETTWGNTGGGIVCVLGAAMDKDKLPFGLQWYGTLRHNDNAGFRAILKSAPPYADASPASAAPKTVSHAATKPAVPPVVKPSAPAAKPSYSSASKPASATKRRKKYRAFRAVKAAADWVWLIALIPLSVGAMYGAAAFSAKWIPQNFFLLALIFACLVFLVKPGEGLPFYTNRTAGRAVKHVRFAALLACFAVDIIFINYYSGETAFTPEGFFRVGAYAAPQLLFFVLQKFCRNITRRLNYSPLTAYICFHAFDAFAVKSGAALLGWAILIYAVLLAVLFLRPFAVKNRVALKILRPVGYAVFAALFFAAAFLGNPVF